MRERGMRSYWTFRVSPSTSFARSRCQHGVLLYGAGGESYPFLLHVELRVRRHGNHKTSRSVSSTAVDNSRAQRGTGSRTVSCGVSSPPFGTDTQLLGLAEAKRLPHGCGWSQLEMSSIWLDRVSVHGSNSSDSTDFTWTSRPQNLKNRRLWGGDRSVHTIFYSSCNLPEPELPTHARDERAPEGRPVHSSRPGVSSLTAGGHVKFAESTEPLAVEVPLPSIVLARSFPGSESAFVLYPARWRYPRGS